MQIYEIKVPELKAGVKFKVLSISDIDDFLNKRKNKSSNSIVKSNDLRKDILKYVVYNLNTDVAAALSILSRTAAERALEAIYAGCIMLNPGLDLEYWLNIAYSTAPIDADDDGLDTVESIRNFMKQASKLKENKKVTTKVVKSKKMSRIKFLGLENHLKSSVIGQDEAIDEILSSLYRMQADLNDEDRPLGIFVFAGSSGVGKTHLVKCLSDYLYGQESQVVRIDCGEFQHKHENQKLIGSPPGYVGHDEGGQLTNQVKKNPHSVILIDEVEKAHQDIWNTFLRIFDEGFATDSKGDKIDFRNTIIIMTTNLGNDKTVNSLISKSAGFTGNIEFNRRTQNIPSRTIVEKNTHEAINKYFTPEFINRIDKIVVFNHLQRNDCEKIAQIEMSFIADKLSKKGISLEYTDNVIDGLIDLGIDSVKGARGIAQIRRDLIETRLAKAIVKSSIPKGTIFHIDYLNDNFIFDFEKPVKKSKQTGGDDTNANR
jgi:ATP-dependent Clp protease ATP-binding subunit ClpA